MLGMDLMMKSFKVKNRSGGVARVRWWNLNRANATKLVGKIKSKARWEVIDNVDAMWDGMANCIRRSAEEVLGVSRGGG